MRQALFLLLILLPLAAPQGHALTDTQTDQGEPGRGDSPLPEGALAARSDVLASQQREQAQEEILAVLERQMAAWNRGDLETFCADYTENTMFVSPSGLTRGRQQVLERYQRRYPDRAAQGILTLEPIQLDIHGAGGCSPPAAASLVATWTLSYPEQADKETASGLTLLVFERRADGWKIVRDASM